MVDSQRRDHQTDEDNQRIMTWLASKPVGVDPLYDEALKRLETAREAVWQEAAKHNAARGYSVMYREDLICETVNGERTLVIQLVPVMIANRPTCGVYW